HQPGGTGLGDPGAAGPLRARPAPPRRGDGAAVRAAEDPADDRDHRSRHVLPPPGPLVAAGAVRSADSSAAAIRSCSASNRVSRSSLMPALRSAGQVTLQLLEAPDGAGR